MYTLMCIHENLLVFAAVPAHNRWLSPDVKASISTCKSIFIFPHYLPAYQNEPIKVAASLGFWLPARDDFHSIKLANQTLGWQKRRQISPYELFSTISQYICIAYANFPCTWSHLTGFSVSISVALYGI